MSRIHQAWQASVGWTDKHHAGIYSMTKAVCSSQTKEASCSMSQRIERHNLCTAVSPKGYFSATRLLKPLLGHTDSSNREPDKRSPRQPLRVTARPAGRKTT